MDHFTLIHVDKKTPNQLLPRQNQNKPSYLCTNHQKLPSWGLKKLLAAPLWEIKKKYHTFIEDQSVSFRMIPNSILHHNR